MRTRVLSGLVVAAAVAVLFASGAAQGRLIILHPCGPDCPLFAQLRGSHEPSNGSPGRGSFAAVIHKPRRFCFGIMLDGAGRASGAQLHRGTAHRTGPVVLALSAPSSGNPGASSGCVTAAASLLKTVRAHPGRFYVEVTTANGGVRGQLFHPVKEQDR